MIKREIKEFKLYCDGLSGYSVEVPFSIYSALVGAGLAERKNTGITGTPPRSARIEASLSADESFFNGKFSYLAFGALTTDAELYINGIRKASLEGGRRRQLVDVAGALSVGENKIEIVFNAPTLGSGLLASVDFMKFNSAVIDSVTVNERFDDDAVMLDIDLTVIGDGSSARAVATLISGSGQIYYGGFNGGRATVTVKDPLLWWPKGLGVQNIYKLSVNLYGEMEIEDTAEFKIGLRKMTPDTASGGVLLRANGVPFIPMGAVYTPEKNYLPVEEAKRTAAFVTYGAMANFNSFVIRAGEPLPDERFFDLCDVHGIAVICEMGALDKVTIDTVSRLAHHPSFAPIDLISLSDGQLDEWIKEMPSSLTYSSHEKAPVYFGEASVPFDRSFFAAVPEGERNIFSDSMEMHSGGLSREIVHAVSENYLYAYNPSDLAYLTRLSQAERTEREMVRARLASGACGRAVFSSFGAERLISDSAIDPMASPKALFYRAAGFFSPVLVSAEISDSTVTFFAANLGKTAVFGGLEYRIIDSENRLIFKDRSDIDVSEHSARLLFSVDLSEHIASHECDRYIEFVFSEGSHIHSKGVKLFTAPKRFKFEKPEITAEIEGGDRHFHITITADKYVGALELGFTDVDAVFSDNYFDITSPMPIKIGFTVNSPVETVKTLKKQLKIRSLYDIGR